MKEFLLNALFSGEELNVVNEEKIDIPITSPEFCKRVFLNTTYKFVCELLARHVNDAGVGVAIKRLMGHGVHKVGFAQASLTIEE